MAILSFQKPDKVTKIESDDFRGKFEFKPLEPGFGLTIGNALRRVLLSSLEGFAITSIRIENVEHEFSTIPGVKEDVTEFILNLKQIRFKQQIEGQNHETVTAVITNKEVLTAGDLQAFISGFQILNPDLVLLNMEKKKKIHFEFSIDKGRGFVLAEENKRPDEPIGTIFIDSIFTPIKLVKYDVENFRVEQKTDYEKLIFDITTDGSIHPQEALTEAAKILIQHFVLFSDSKITLDDETEAREEVFDEESLQMRQMLKTKIDELKLSVRAINCLKSAEVETLGDLVSYNKNDLMKFRNFGKKSLSELTELLEKKKLTFGMDISKYGL